MLNATTNQKSVSAVGEHHRREVIAAECVGGTLYNCLGVANRAAKNKKMKYTIAFGRPPIDNGSHNNQQKQASTIEGSMERMCAGQEAWGEA
jgi:hypothetical protein